MLVLKVKRCHDIVCPCIFVTMDIKNTHKQHKTKKSKGRCSPDPYCNRRLKHNDWNGYRAAGVVPFRRKNNCIEVLLGYGHQKPREQSSFHVLSGKVETYDRNLYATAQREFDEESGFFFNDARSATALNKYLRHSPILWIPECKMGLIMLNTNRCSKKVRQVFHHLDGMYDDLISRNPHVTPFDYLQWVNINYLQPISCNFVTRQLLKRKKYIRSWR